MKATVLFFSLILSVNVLFSQNDSIEWGGIQRYYLVHEPSTFQSSTEKYLVLALHGGVGSG